MKMHSILAFVLTLGTAFATSFYIKPFSEFTKTTSNIIRGKLSNIRVEHSAGEDGRIIYTFANLEIKDVIKGNITGSQILIRKLGGTKDGVTLEIPSSVEFTEKEEGVFFLGDIQEDHSYEVSGLELGKFNLVEKNGEEILKGGIFAYSQPHSKPGHEHDLVAENISENLKPWSIHQLKELVKSQQQLPTVTSVTKEIQKNAEISRPLTEPKGTPTLETNTQVEQKGSISEEKENSLLYFSSTVWYSLATIVLTLGVFWHLRRG